MRCIRLPKPTRSILLFLGAFFLPAAALSLAAQSTNKILPAFVYDKAHEITVEATIQELVSTPAPGTPAGVRLLVTAPAGMFDAHLGPFLTRETIDALHAGMAIEITGALQEFRDKQYLFARQITVAGRTITIRNPRGYLVRPLPPRNLPRSNEKHPQSEGNGGAR
jgi:hypothetical protein